MSDALAAVLALHTPQERCCLEGGDWSVTRDDWDDDDGDPETFLVCAECGRIELREEQGDDEWASYLVALWPCPTIRAIEAAS